MTLEVKCDIIIEVEYDKKGGEKVKPTALIVATIFIVFDVATGWLKALSTGTTDSSIMRQGLFRKIAEIMAVIFGYVCEYAFPYAGLDVTIPFATGISTYIVLMETVSIIENLALMNPQLAEVLNKFFATKNGKGGEENDSKSEDEPTDSV